MPILAILFAAAHTVAAAPPRHSSHQCVAVDVVQPRGQRVASSGKGKRRPRPVSVADTVDLQLQVQVRPELKGDHVLRLDLFTPSGYLYQSMTLPFRFASPKQLRAARGEPVTRSVAGFPRPLEVQLLTTHGRHGRPADRVTARLPVAGTSIALGSLFGRWKAVPYVDDGAAPCGPGTSFEIAE
jgi:hypothetical protein